MEYTDLIKACIVKNEKGECYAPYNGQQSITHCIGVKSERGLYRVWISNLQKMIRRGKLNEAITSMIECVESGDVFKTNVINRLAKVIVSEDIGLAYPTLPLYCSKFVKKYDEGKLTNEDLIHLVNVLVKSKKSRLIDNLYLLCEKGLTYSFDDSFKFFKEAMNDKDVIKAVSYLNSCVDTSVAIKKTITLNGIKKRQQIYEIWEYILNKSGVVYRINYALLELYISQEKNSGKKLNIIQAMLNVMFKREIDFNSCLNLCDEDFKGEWKRNLEVWPWSISYDKHSISNAYKLGRSDKFFFEHGAHLENKSDDDWLKTMEEKYQPKV